MGKKTFFIGLVAVATAFIVPAAAGSKGYYVDQHGEFRKMRCTINGSPVGSRHACSDAAHRVRTQSGWAQGQGPRVPAYYEVGMPEPRYGGRYLHNRTVWHEHQGPYGAYQHYGYLGHHQYNVVPSIPNRIVHTGGGVVGKVYGFED